MKQKKLQSLQKNTLALVLLDEVGLAEQSPHNPLKVLHSRLEPRDIREAVPVVAISNWELDRSKMNRALTLACPAADKSDLKRIAMCIIRFYWEEDGKAGRELKNLLGALADQYTTLVERQYPEDFHGLRDWYGMCHYAARLLLAADSQQGSFDSTSLEGASGISISDGMKRQAGELLELMRRHKVGYNDKVLQSEWALHLAILINFGGNPFSSADDEASYFRMIETLYQDKTSIPLQSVLESVQNTDYQIRALLEDVDGRHAMIITDAPGPVMAWIKTQATEIGAGWDPECFVGSCLQDDDESSDIYAQGLLQSIIVSMSHKKRLMILHNLDTIYPALYDVFNSNYTKSGGGSQKYCRVARAGFCNPRCAVADQFKVIVVVTPARARLYEPALLNRFSKHYIGVQGLVYGEEEAQARDVWQNAITNIHDSKSEKSYVKDTDIVPACPPDFMDMVALSARTRLGTQDEGDSGAFRKSLVHVMGPLLAPELVNRQFWQERPEEYRGPIKHAEPYGRRRGMPTFEMLLEVLKGACFDPSDGSERKAHTIIPVLVPTFKPGIGTSETHNIDRISEQLNDTHDVAKVILMKRETSEASLREKMGKYVQQVVQRAVDNGRNGVPDMLTVLHMHIDMGLENAQDQVDFARIQIEWAIRELIQQLDIDCEKDRRNIQPNAKGCHIFALVVHSRRGSKEPEERMRPFLLAGPCDTTASDWVSLRQWNGMMVDSFTSLLSWGVESSTVLKGSRSKILGLENKDSNGYSRSFQNFLRDSLSSIVPRFSPQVEPSDTNAELRKAVQECHSLVELLEKSVADRIDNETDDGIKFSVKNPEDVDLLRRTGSYQLAVLSRVRCDDHLLPVLEAIWFYAIQYSCPSTGGRREAEAWKKLSKCLIEEHTEKRLQILSVPPSRLLGLEMRMPGSSVILQQLLPLASAVDELKR